jgi:O-antigen/teichoic acid export membrane protein
VKVTAVDHNPAARAANAAPRLRPTRDLIVILAGRSLIVVLSIATIRLLTTFLTPVEVGRYNILLGLGSGFALVLISPVGSYVNRRIIEWARTGIALPQLGRYALIVSVVALLATLSLLVLQSVGWLGLQIAPPWLVVAVIATVLVSNLSSIAPNALNLFGRRFEYVITSTLTGALALVFSVVLVDAVQGDAEHWIMGSLVGQAASLIVGILLLWNLLKPSQPTGVPSSAWHGVFRFSAPLAVFNILYWGQTQGFRFVLDQAHGLAAVGLFTAGFGLGVAVVAALDQVLTQYLNTFFYEAISDSGPERRAVAWNQYARAFVPAIVILTMCTVGVGPYLAHLLTGHAFAATAARVVAWGAVAEGLRTLISLVSLIAHAGLETRPLILPGIIGVAVSLGGTVVLARVDPIAGTGFSVVVGAATWLTLLLVSMRRLLPGIQVPWRRALTAAGLATPLLVPLLLPWARDPSLRASVLIIIASGLVMMVMQYKFVRSQ